MHPQSLRSPFMAKQRSIGNMVAPWRFIMFVLLLLAGTVPAGEWFANWWLGIMAAFDVAAIAFLASCAPLLAIDDPVVIERQRRLAQHLPASHCRQTH